jgi:peptide deformylase
MAYSLVSYPDLRLKVDHSNRIRFTEYRDSIEIAFAIMDKVMAEEKGLGIAAVQVGIHLPICIVGDIHMINPEVCSMSLEYGSMLEGCLSCPKERIMISRPKDVNVRYQNLKGKTIRTKLDGLYARCFLHEVDHIRGKLIKDYSAN